MFDLLQLKDERVFQTLHNLFKSFGWMEALDVLVRGLNEALYGYLIEECTGIVESLIVIIMIKTVSRMHFQKV